MIEVESTRRIYRYAVIEWEFDEEYPPEDTLISRHQTKAAAIKAEKRAKKEAKRYSNVFVSAVHWSVEAQTYRVFSSEDYALCSVEQLGECTLCQLYERPCSKRQKNGKCPYTKTGPWRVYALIDPNDGQTRYVGSTEQPLRKRLNGHICKGTSKEAHQWIQSLLAKGKRPIIQEVTQHTTWKEAVEHEYRLINILPGLFNGSKTRKGINF